MTDTVVTPRAPEAEFASRQNRAQESLPRAPAGIRKDDRGVEAVGSVLELVGETPLLRLNYRLARGVKPALYAKLEQLNPGGSVKDRIGSKMVEAAERAHLLRKGGAIVEATSGNTGVGLAMVAAIKGYRTVFVMPDKMSAEKVALLKAYGADVVVTPTNVARESPDSYYRIG